MRSSTSSTAAMIKVSTSGENNTSKPTVNGPIGPKSGCWAAGNSQCAKADSTRLIGQANSQPTAVTTEVQGKVDSVDLTQSPPTLSINSQDYALTQIKRIVSSN